MPISERLKPQIGPTVYQLPAARNVSLRLFTLSSDQFAFFIRAYAGRLAVDPDFSQKHYGNCRK